jgi:hypothetical protein
MLYRVWEHEQTFNCSLKYSYNINSGRTFFSNMSQFVAYKVASNVIWPYTCGALLSFRQEEN